MNTVSILGIPVAQTTVSDTVDVLAGWVAGPPARARTVVAANVHVLTEARGNPVYRQALLDADLVLPDGMPLVWASRMLGAREADRCYGPDVMRTALARSITAGFVHFLYGSTRNTLEQLVNAIRSNWPSAAVAGAIAPGFGKPDPAEEASQIERINASGANLLWIGMGCPKQELWMQRCRDRLSVRVAVAVGAAFDFLAGVKPQASPLLQRAGLEWLFRLRTEPRRLWRRYLIRNPLFVALFLRQWTRERLLVRADRHR